MKSDGKMSYIVIHNCCSSLDRNCYLEKVHNIYVARVLCFFCPVISYFDFIILFY